MRATAQQLYPPEPPVTFAPPTRRVEAQQLYPPEPPLSFPPARDELADQTYPPEPPPTFPPQNELTEENSGHWALPPARMDAEIAHSDVLGVVSSADVTDPTALQATGVRGLRAEAEALTQSDLSELSVGHVKVARAMDLSELYLAGAVLLVVVGVMLRAVVGKRDKASDPADRRVAFSASYEPFLG